MNEKLDTVYFDQDTSIEHLGYAVNHIVDAMNGDDLLQEEEKETLATVCDVLKEIQERLFTT